MNKTGKILLILSLVVIFAATFWHFVFAGPTLYQRCEQNKNCLLGEFLFDGDYNAVTTDVCTIDVRNPGGTLIINSASTTFNSDGWHDYTLNFGYASTTGLYRAAMCCTYATETVCIDKSFILGASFDTLKEAKVGTMGVADSGTVSTLVDDALTQSDDFWNGMTLVIISGTNSGEIREITDFDSASTTITVSPNFTAAIDNTSEYLIRREFSLTEKIWGYTGSTLDTANNAIAKVWSYASRKLTSRQIATSSEYIAGVTTSTAIAQVAEKSVVDAIEYDVDLIRGVTFDFAGFADSGSSSSTLVDSELTHPDDYWNNYRLIMMSGSNFGEDRTISDFDAASDTITVSSPFTNAISSGDKYVLFHEDRLTYQIWNYTTRTLTSFGTLVSDIWSNATRSLTEFGSLAADVWNATYAPTRTLTDYATSSIATAVWDKATSSLTTTSSIGRQLAENVDTTISSRASQASLDALNDISAADVWSYATRGLTENVDLTSTSTQAIWDIAKTQLTASGSIGKHIVDNLDVAVSTRSTLTAADVWSNVTRTLTDYATSTIAQAVWINATRTLTNYGNDITAADVWDVLSSTLTTTSSIGKQLADNVDTTISSRATDAGVWTNATRTLTDYASSTIAAAVWTNATRTLTGFGTLVADIWSNTTRTLTDYASSTIAQAVWSNTTRALTEFGSLAADVWNATYAPTRTLTDYATSSIATAVWDKATSSLTTTSSIGRQLAENVDISISSLRGTSTSVDLTLLAGYVDEVEGYIGIPTDTTTSTIFGAIRDVRTKLDQLDTLETKIDTVDTIIDLIRASQLLGYTLELSDVGEVVETNNYRAKLTILDYESNPVDASSTPTIILYDALRATATSTTMTKLSTGVYEFVYTVASGAANGTWEALVSVDLGGSANVQLNDYWEVEGSPAQVIINYMSDIALPTIAANVTISNEGSTGYEYQYEYCVVQEETNQCGGGDDLDYASAAKYLNTGEDWTTDLQLTLSNFGDYWFKVVVYWGTETSGASRTFTVYGGGVTEAAAVTVTAGASLDTIYSKLLEVQEDIGYRGKPGIPQEGIEATVYETLRIMGERLETVAGSDGCGLCNIYKLQQQQSSDIDYLKNKLLELKSLLEVNKLLIDKAANKPVIKTWFEWGSVILKMLVINPSDSQPRTVPFKAYLPSEIKPEHIIDREDLALDFDEENNLWYVHKEIRLGPGKSATKRVELKDIWVISDEEIDSLRNQFEELIKPLEKTAFFAQAVTLKSDADRLIDGIIRKQNEYKATPQEHIVAYRENQESLRAVESNLEALQRLVAEQSGAGRAIGSLFGVSTTMTWAIIIIVVVGIAVLMTLLYVLLMRHRALEEYIAPGRKFRRLPIIDLKKHAVRIKGGLITYLLPPFGKPIVDIRRLIRVIRFLIIIGVLIGLILLGINFVLKFF